MTTRHDRYDRLDDERLAADDRARLKDDEFGLTDDDIAEMLRDMAAEHTA